MKLDALYRRTVCNMHQQRIREVFERIADRTGCRLKARKQAKGTKRLLEKVEETLTHIAPALGSRCQRPEIRSMLRMAGDFVVDINGVTLVADSTSKLQNLYEELRQFSWQPQGMKMLRMQNGFHQSLRPQTGYRDLKVWMLVKVASDAPPMLVECQLHLKPFYSRKESLMHLLYEIERGDFDHPVSSHVKEQRRVETIRWQEAEVQACEALDAALRASVQSAILNAITEAEKLDPMTCNVQRQLMVARERLETLQAEEIEACIIALKEAIAGTHLETLQAAFFNAKAKGVDDQHLAMAKPRLLELQKRKEELSLALVALERVFDASTEELLKKLASTEELQTCISVAEELGATETDLYPARSCLSQLQEEMQRRRDRMEAKRREQQELKEARKRHKESLNWKSERGQDIWEDVSP
eukprot:gnl/MRDRNA2_/MRDRNA2_83286_c0_seq1.p1 gnl/MRDRNA2_/MRDRNA2_83286_c0~~gnl/MRDRNA2_/MRDRNA2_83286_c0_seq1.p1  ORF type:complete len:441 (-),score=109.23 gnl/MRDRNA2_/MRDRNA2_83286_c0_seq1:1038-2285(-)